MTSAVVELPTGCKVPIAELETATEKITGKLYITGYDDEKLESPILFEPKHGGGYELHINHVGKIVLYLGVHDEKFCKILFNEKVYIIESDFLKEIPEYKKV